MQRLVRFARYWDLVANSGRFTHATPALLGEHPFANFMAFSDWLYANTDATHRIALDRLAVLVGRWLGQHMPAQEVAELLARDGHGVKQKSAQPSVAPQRQARHMAA
jgi:hypothetical protein